MGGIVNMVKSVVDTVAPIASMIPGVGILAMGLKAATDIGSNIMKALDTSNDQDNEDEQTTGKQSHNAQAAQQDFGGVDQLLQGGANIASGVMGAATGVVGDVIGAIGL